MDVLAILLPLLVKKKPDPGFASTKVSTPSGSNERTLESVEKFGGAWSRTLSERSQRFAKDELCRTV